MYSLRSLPRWPILVIAAGLVMASNASAGQKPKEWNPVIEPANFVATVDNPYFPLSPGRSWLYRGVTKSGTETFQIDVTRQTKVILGVRTRVVIETAAVDGQTVEISENWFAQDREGNVWYFGEFSRTFEGGVPVSTAGSWEAGVNDARPGIIMEANPVVGDTYFQEFAPGVAQDMASVVATGRTETVPYGTFENVLLTKEWTALESNSVGHKSYAPGIGLILDEKGGERLELTQVR